MTGPIVITVSDFNGYGCPHCGHKHYYQRVSGPKGGLLTCASPACQRGFVVVDDGELASPYGFGSENIPTFYPPMQPHPLKMGGGQ